MLVLNGNYRSPLSFTEESISAAEQGLNRLRTSLKPATSGAAGASPEMEKNLSDLAQTTRQIFTNSMDDDINTSGALGGIFELVRQVNTTRDAGATDEQLEPAQKALRELTTVLGLRMENSRTGGDADKFVDLLIELRTELRAQKLWALSDLLRDRLKEMGVGIEDAKAGGTSWKWE